MESEPTVVTEFPHTVRVVHHAWIPMSDGMRLAAKLWIPEDAEEHPVPAILEYIPYRKNDCTAVRDNAMHAYFAGHGYVSVRVDLRGSGDSDGILYDEYLPLEQSDGVEVIAWLAAQPFCSGTVGMIGISWGGFNGLQVASHAPPALKAVVSVCSTDDRYTDDVHYIGGVLHGEDQLGWASVMLGYNARPPDPEVVGESWRERWFERLEKTPAYVEEWTRHQRRDAFWKQGSVNENYSAIKSAVYMVGGWQDGYKNAILRFLAGYGGPRKGLIGPWGHQYPNFGSPGPAIGFLQECVRWWDCHLKGDDNGIMDEPQLRVFLPEAIRPSPASLPRTGVWLAEPSWPSPNVTTQSYRPSSDGRLLEGDEPAKSGARLVPSVQAIGFDYGVWCGYGGPVDNPSEQRGEDSRSLVFDSAPLEGDVPILGRPRAVLEIESDQPLAQVAVRLCDLWPDGASTLITRGMLNLAHRRGHEDLAPLQPGVAETVVVELDAVGYKVPAGHRVRMAVSSAYFPTMWPAPRPVELTVHAGGSTSLELPVRLRPAGEEDREPEHFAAPQAAPELAYEALTPRDSVSFNRVSRDTGTGTYELVTSRRDRHVRIEESGREYAESGRASYRIVEGDPLSALVTSEQSHLIARGDWRTRVETKSTISATEDDFLLSNELDAFEGDERVFSKVWRARIPRDYT